MVTDEEKKKRKIESLSKLIFPAWRMDTNNFKKRAMRKTNYRLNSTVYHVC